MENNDIEKSIDLNNEPNIDFKKVCRRYKFLFSIRGLLISFFVEYLNFFLFGINMDTILFSNVCSPIFVIVFFIYACIICKQAEKKEHLKERIINFKNKNKKKRSKKGE